jgi:sugar phosphate isomerase/epimerase
MSASVSRRDFLLASAAFAGMMAHSASAPEGNGGRIRFGACRPLGDASLLKSVGYDFIECDVASCLIPAKGADDWKRQLDLIASLSVPLEACNCLIPGSYRLTGPKADHAPALDYVETVMERADQAGVKYLVFGSGGARNVPGDFLSKDGRGKPDLERGVGQFTEFCRRLSGRAATLKNVTVVIEPLRPNESNIVNYVWQAIQISDDVNSPRVQVLADFYHMMMGRESADSILSARSRLRHCHIAEFRSRAFPGSNSAKNEMYRPYFDALKAIGYTGGVSCECGWGAKKDLARNLETSLGVMRSFC